MKGASDQSVGPVRAGQGLLAGLLRCGRCGRKLHVRLKALERLRAEDQDQRQALVRKLQHCEYETRRAFEQYNEVDPRHRLVASELERRWNEKLEELGQLRSTLAEMDAAAWVLGDREQERILALGRQFREVWKSDQCPVEIKKRIIRTVVEELIVDKDETGILRFVIHWKGGTHTQFEMKRPLFGREQRTASGDVEIIRPTAARRTDAGIEIKGRTLAFQKDKGRSCSQPVGRRPRTDAAATMSGPRPGDPPTETAFQPYGLGRGITLCLVKNKLLENRQMGSSCVWEIKAARVDSHNVGRSPGPLRAPAKLAIVGVHS